MHTWTKLCLWGSSALLAIQIAGCCKIFDKGDTEQPPPQDGPDPVTGKLPPPRNGFLADLKFRPETNGFNFENGGGANYPRTPGFVGPKEMIRLFGAKEVCIGGNAKVCRLTPAAAQFAAKVNKSMNGGQCEGMAVASLTMFKGIDSLAQLSPSARTVHDLSREQARSMVGYYFAYQFSDPVIAAKIDAKRRYTPVQTMERVVQLIQQGDPGVLFMRSPDNMSGHAVTPYAVEDRGNGVHWIRIYDNNWPNKERYVEVNKNENTWKYELAAINPAVPKMPWAGNAVTQNFGVVPISVRQQKMKCPFCRTTRSRSVWGDSSIISSITVTDPQGNTATAKDGQVSGAQMPNVKFTWFDVWRDGQASTDVMVEVEGDDESGEYHFDLEGKDGAKDGDDDDGVAVFSAGMAVKVEAVKIAPKTKDRITLGPGGSGIKYKRGSTGKVPAMTVAMDDDKSGYVFRVGGMVKDDKDKDDDDDDVEVKVDRGGKFQVFGAGKGGRAYDLKVTRVKEKEEDDDVQENKGQKFAKPGEAHTVNFAGWGGRGKPLKVDKAVVKRPPKKAPAKPGDKDDKKDDAKPSIKLTKPVGTTKPDAKPKIVLKPKK